MQNIQKSREMLAQIGAACVQITLGCQQAQNEPDPVQLFLGVQELEYALGALHENAVKLRESIDPERDHDGDTQPQGFEPPMLKCTCGYHGPINDDDSCPRCGDGS